MGKPHGRSSPAGPSPISGEKVGLWLVEIDAANEVVTHFEDSKVTMTWQRPTQRAGRKAFGSRQEVERALWEAARKCGVQPDAYLASVKETEDRILPFRQDYGVISGWFKVRVHGHEFLNASPGMKVLLDSQTGQLLWMLREPDAIVDTWQASLTQERAIELAERAYELYNARKERISKGPVQRDLIKVGYAVPNGLFDAPNGFGRAPYHARLAHHGPFGPQAPRKPEFIWIDAVDGCVLGGYVVDRITPLGR